MVRVGTCTESSYLFDMSAKTTIWLSPQNRVFVACTSVKITSCSWLYKIKIGLFHGCTFLGKS
jgi:competence transcription factor ComK